MMNQRNTVRSVAAAGDCETATAVRGFANGLLLAAFVWIGLGYVALVLR